MAATHICSPCQLRLIAGSHLIRSLQTPAGNWKSSQRANQESAALWYARGDTNLWEIKGALLAKKISIGQREGARLEKEEGNSKMEEKEDKTKPTDWDSSGFYILLPCEEDCSPETMTRAFTKNTMARAECSPLHQQLASLCNGPFKVHKNNTVYERVICLVTSGDVYKRQTIYND